MLRARGRGGSGRIDPSRHVRPDRPAADRPMRSPHFSPTIGRIPTNDWSIACWAVLGTASAGDSTGSTWRTTRTRTGSSWTPSDPMPGAIATGSSRSLNADLPYDRFLMLQVAGDDLLPSDHEALIATGFCRCGPREVVGGNIIPEVKRQTELSEITNTVGSVFLGLTIGCARCHDHKFDAIPTTDYYRLQAFFAASELADRADRRQGRERGLCRRGKGDRGEDRASQERAVNARSALPARVEGEETDHAECRKSAR